MIRVLVAGASGFIGHHLTALLRREGYWVRAADLRPPLFGVSNADQFELLDLRRRPDCLRATKDVDQVYALAADPVSTNNKFNSSSAALGNDSLINFELIEAARQNGVRRYLYLSSEHVYPESRRAGSVPLKEEDALDPSERDQKGWANLEYERICVQYRESYGLETRIVRTHDVYGPLAIWIGGDETPVAELCRKVAAAQLEGLHEVEIAGDGERMGSYLYIDDCITGLHQIMRSDCRRPVNLEHDRVLSISELADMIASIAGARMTKRFLPSTEVSSSCQLDRTLLERTIEWKPMPIEHGIRHTYEWIAEQVRELASEYTFGIEHFPRTH
jgi:GDP-D-mannose 3',5'-epimerase